MKKEKDMFFEKPFIKEYILNLQVNEKINIVEFLFTRKILILLVLGISGIVYVDEMSTKRNILIGILLIFVYLFKNNNITKKEKYLISEAGTKRKGELVLHNFYNRAVRGVLRQKLLTLSFVLLFAFQGVSEAKFITEIVKSVAIQEGSNQLYKAENDEMIKQAKIKNIHYLSQEKKFATMKHLKELISIESDLLINIIKTNIEKEKYNVIRK